MQLGRVDCTRRVRVLGRMVCSRVDRRLKVDQAVSNLRNEMKLEMLLIYGRSPMLVRKDRMQTGL